MSRTSGSGRSGPSNLTFAIRALEREELVLVHVRPHVRAAKCAVERRAELRHRDRPLAVRVVVDEGVAHRDGELDALVLQTPHELFESAGRLV